MRANTHTIGIQVLHWDGRLDNRSDLLSQLSDSLQGESSDEAIARAAYERWGTDGYETRCADSACSHQLIGHTNY